jgi:hypothetical protein
VIAATLLAVAAALPLGVWPSEMGPAATTVHDVEFYLVDPEDDYTILAVQPLVVPLKKAEPAELDRLAALAEKLGADGVLLLGEMPEKSIPEDFDAPLPTTRRYSVAVFLSFDRGEESEGRPAVPSAAHRPRGRPHLATITTRGTRAPLSDRDGRSR